MFDVGLAATFTELAPGELCSRRCDVINVPLLPHYETLLNTSMKTLRFPSLPLRKPIAATTQTRMERPIPKYRPAHPSEGWDPERFRTCSLTSPDPSSDCLLQTTGWGERKRETVKSTSSLCPSLTSPPITASKTKTCSPA